MIDVDALLAAPLRHAWGSTTTRTSFAPSSSSAAQSPNLARAHALAKRLPMSVEGHGGDETLLKAATELATLLGEDAGAIEAVLVESFNPRCVPPWPAHKLRREAERAAGRESSPESRFARRVAERSAEAAARDAYRPATSPDEAAAGLGPEVDWGAPEVPIAWYCEELGIAASERKVTLIGGDPGAGKGPLAGYLAACFALGEPVFGKFDVKQCNVGILDFEGARLSRRRIASHVRGLERDPLELRGRLRLHDVEPIAMSDLGWLRAWVVEHSIEALVVDSYMSAMSWSDADPNSPEHAYLARELGKLGIVVIIVAHARKPAAGKRGERPALGDIAGSFALAGMAATAIAVWKPDEEQPNLVRIGCMRAPEEAFATFDVQWSKRGNDAAPAWSAELLGETSREQRAADHDADVRRKHDRECTQIAARVLDHMRLNVAWPQNVGSLAKATGGTVRVVGEVLGALARAGFAHHEPSRDGRTGGTYVLGQDCPRRVAMHEGAATAVEEAASTPAETPKGAEATSPAPLVGRKFARPTSAARATGTSAPGKRATH